MVHIQAGVAALAALVTAIGTRLGYGEQHMAPHQVPMVVMGAGLLWFGWFGFNAGSALAPNSDAVHAFVTTNTAAAAGVIS